MAGFNPDEYFREFDSDDYLSMFRQCAPMAFRPSVISNDTGMTKEATAYCIRLWMEKGYIETGSKVGLLFITKMGKEHAREVRRDAFEKSRVIITNRILRPKSFEYAGETACPASSQDYFPGDIPEYEPDALFEFGLNEVEEPDLELVGSRSSAPGFLEEE